MGKIYYNPAPRERGRENGSFPVAEALKPLGFKEERSDDQEGLALPASIWIFKIVFIFLAIKLGNGYSREINFPNLKLGPYMQ